MDTADARADMHADAIGIGFRNLNPGVFNRLDTGDHTKLDEAIHLARFLFRQIVAGIKILYFTGNSRSKPGSVKLCDFANTAFARENIFPVFINTDTERRDNSQTGNNYASFAQTNILISHTLKPKRPPPRAVT